MRLTCGTQVIETDATVLLEVEPEEVWHACWYPARPEVLRIRPGSKCDGPDCGPVSLKALHPPRLKPKPPEPPTPQTEPRPAQDGPPTDFMPGFVGAGESSPPPVPDEPSESKSRFGRHK